MDPRRFQPHLQSQMQIEHKNQKREEEKQQKIFMYRQYEKPTHGRGAERENHIVQIERSFLLRLKWVPEEQRHEEEKRRITERKRNSILNKSSKNLRNKEDSRISTHNTLTQWRSKYGRTVRSTHSHMHIHWLHRCLRVFAYFVMILVSERRRHFEEIPPKITEPK